MQFFDIKYTLQKTCNMESTQHKRLDHGYTKQRTSGCNYRAYILCLLFNI